MQIFEIPLTAQPQTFGITLGKVDYQMSIYYANVPSGGWMLNIATSTGSQIVGGIPLVTGVDLLAPYDYLGFSGSLIVQTDHDTDAVPTFTNLGSTSHLYYIPAP